MQCEKGTCIDIGDEGICSCDDDDCSEGGKSTAQFDSTQSIATS